MRDSIWQDDQRNVCRSRVVFATRTNPNEPRRARLPRMFTGLFAAHSRVFPEIFPVLGGG